MFARKNSLSQILLVSDFIYVDSFKCLTLISRFRTNYLSFKIPDLKWALNNAAKKGDLQAVINNNPKMVTKIDTGGECITV